SRRNAVLRRPRGTRHPQRQQRTSLGLTPAGVTWGRVVALSGYEGFCLSWGRSVVVVAVMTSLAFDIYLRATPQQVREVVAEPGLVPRWLSGMPFRPAGEEDPGRLTCEWLQTDHLEINGGCTSVVRFDFVAMGQVTRLMVNHKGLDPDGSLLKVIAPGWPMI